jgi:DNA repair photolyase
MIYEPQGKAREYAPLALNLYTQCGHGCVYCYVPDTLRIKQDEYCVKDAESGNITRLEESVKRYEGSGRYVHISFAGDPYDLTRYRKTGCKDDTNVVTRKALELCLQYRVPVQILTKGGLYCLKDGDLFERFGGSIRVGQSLTFWDEKLSAQYEPSAAKPQERLDALAILKRRNIPTWASFEPVIDSGQTLMLLQECLANDIVDYYRIGAFSPSSGLKEAPKVDWDAFLSVALSLINHYGARAYFKRDLRLLAPDASRELTPCQSNPDAFMIPAFRIAKDDGDLRNGTLSQTTLMEQERGKQSLFQSLDNNNDDFPLPDKTQNNFCDCEGCQ